MDPRVLKVVDYIEANPHLHLQLDQLAKTMNMSSSRLRHIFTAQVGVSPKQYPLLTRTFSHFCQSIATFANANFLPV